jgi:hypothetical protein
MDTKMSKHLEMMNNPDRWPVWPLLPLIKGKNEMGVLLQSEGAYVVVLTNLYMLPKSLDLAPQIKYDSTEAIIADGWIVD